MNAGSKCLTCIIDDLVGALETLGVSRERQFRILRLSLDYLGDNFSSGFPPSTFITAVHRILKKETGIHLPFAKLRQDCNRLGMRLATKVKSQLARLKSPEAQFDSLLRWSVAGNHLDFRTAGKGYGFNLKKIEGELKNIAENEIRIDKSKSIWNKLKGSKRILFIHDNVGEIAFDSLLIKFIRSQDKFVVSALRSGAITSDATIHDGIQVGLNKTANKIISAGPDTLGISWEEMSGSLRKELKQTDFIISKGQANFYVLSEHLSEIPAVVFLLVTKCDYVSGIFGFSGKGGVIKMCL